MPATSANKWKIVKKKAHISKGYIKKYMPKSIINQDIHPNIQKLFDILSDKEFDLYIRNLINNPYYDSTHELCNYINSFFYIQNSTQLISSAFTWTITSQGWQYWNVINFKLIRYKNNIQNEF